MTQVAHEQLPCEEEVLLDYVQRLDRYRKGRRAIYIHLSRLQAHNRRSHHLRIAKTTFETLIRSYDGALFRLFNDDLVVICNGASVAKMDEYVLKLRYLFSEDPLLTGHEDDGEEFCSWYDVEKDYETLLQVVEQAAAARARHDDERQADQSRQASPEELPLTPLDPANLTTILNSIAQADLSTMLRRQPICAVAKGAVPKPLFRELYISIEDLRRQLVPGYEIAANRWLFQVLTRQLDRRMISLLSKKDDSTLTHSFSINLNVETLLSPEFMELDQRINQTSRRTIIIELQLIDVFADISNFMFARDFLHGRGYRICIDGLTYMSLPLIDRGALGIDLVKMLWSPNLIELVKGARGEEVRQAIRRQSAERVIMYRCDNEMAIEVGRSLGIAMFQGFHLDRLVSAESKQRDAVRTLTAAKARHRAAVRATSDPG